MPVTCLDCGVQLATRNRQHKRCKPCAGLARRKLPRVCRICGSPTQPGFDRCRPCYWKERTYRPADALTCPDCGGKKSVSAARCWECSLAYKRTQDPSVFTCTQCGDPVLSRRKLCRSCAAKARHDSPKVCTQCERPAVGRGLCKIHYRDWRRKEYPTTVLKNIKQVVGDMPCACCGYNRTRVQCHRIIPANGYIWGNVAPLCPNCHAEIHRGLREHPDPVEMPT